MIAGAPFGPGADSPLWADAKSEIATLQKDGKINPEEAKALQDGAEKALKDSVKPAYERIIAWLEADRVNTAELAQGAGTLMKDGEAFYNTSLELQTTTPLTACSSSASGRMPVRESQKAKANSTCSMHSRKACTRQNWRIGWSQLRRST